MLNFIAKTAQPAKTHISDNREIYLLVGGVAVLILAAAAMALGFAAKL